MGLYLSTTDDESSPAVGLSYSSFDELRDFVARFYAVKPYSRKAIRKPTLLLPVGGIAFWHHSDCEGRWTPREAGAVANLLRPFAEHWKDNRYGQKAAAIIAVCEDAAHYDRDVTFG